MRNLKGNRADIAVSRALRAALFLEAVTREVPGAPDSVINPAYTPLSEFPPHPWTLPSGVSQRVRRGLPGLCARLLSVLGASVYIGVCPSTARLPFIGARLSFICAQYPFISARLPVRSLPVVTFGEPNPVGCSDLWVSLLALSPHFVRWMFRVGALFWLRDPEAKRLVCAVRVEGRAVGAERAVVRHIKRR
jgi:hypothetical protein